MSVFGHWLLFSPIIELFKWIPLVGRMLASILSFAAAIFAFLWATTLHMLVMSFAWIVYRPLYGILLLTAAGTIIFVMFMFGDEN